MVAVGWAGAKSGLLSPEFGLSRMAYEWAPHVALGSVAAGVFGVIVAMLAGFQRFWLRALLVLTITTMTLLAYVWDRQAPASAAPAPTVPAMDSKAP